MKKLSCKTLYIAWAVMYLLTVALGFLFPEVENLPGKISLSLVTIAFFIPPWMILSRAKKANDRHHIRLIRWLAIGSLTLTVLLLILNLSSAGLGEAMGLALNAALTVVSAPMMCANTFAAPIFLWSCLLQDTFRKK